MILLVDNYDSFSYNLYQLTGEIEPDIKVIRNDEMTIAEIEALAPDQMTVTEIELLNPELIIISPGPGRPENAGICIDIIKYFAGRIPILGVCLGHQAICKAFGATVSYAKELMHGKTSVINADTDSVIFKGLDNKISVARYHSLAAVKETLPDSLKITAETDDGEIMAVEHKEYPVYGLQFHPESILTKAGKRMMENFINSRR